jgi:hypothetical protein
MSRFGSGSFLIANVVRKSVQYFNHVRKKNLGAPAVKEDRIKTLGNVHFFCGKKSYVCADVKKPQLTDLVEFQGRVIDEPNAYSNQRNVRYDTHAIRLPRFQAGEKKINSFVWCKRREIDHGMVGWVQTLSPLSMNYGVELLGPDVAHQLGHPEVPGPDVPDHLVPLHLPRSSIERWGSSSLKSRGGQ